MPITTNNVVAGVNKVFDDIAGDKAEQFVYGVVSEAGILSKEKAPIEFGTLQNSQRQGVTTQNSRVIGFLSYGGINGVGYAGYLNYSDKWKPRPPSAKAGNAWNPNAESRFLEYGFESNEAKAAQENLMKVFKI